jgi:methenyltetrahydromethanopterin cyclohydrolase
MISVNKLAYNYVCKLLESPEYYGVGVETLPSGAYVIDTGLEVEGGYEAGLITTVVAMGGAGKADLGYASYGGIYLPTILVYTDHPAVALFGAQLAGWRVKAEGFRADGSGPARALSLRPKEVFEKIGYKDESDIAVILLETEDKPTDPAAYYIADRCGVAPDQVYMLLTTMTSLAGMTQISGRVVETGLFRLDILGLDLKKVKYASGYAPIMPVHPDGGKAMGRAEDALTYGGVTNYIIDEEESILKELAEKASSKAYPDYGKSSYEIYKEVDFDFTKIDPSLFAPAVVSITCAKTGTTFTTGEVNQDIIKRSITN